MQIIILHPNTTSFWTSSSASDTSEIQLTYTWFKDRISEKKSRRHHFKKSKCAHLILDSRSADAGYNWNWAESIFKKVVSLPLIISRIQHWHSIPRLLVGQDGFSARKWPDRVDTLGLGVPGCRCWWSPAGKLTSLRPPRWRATWPRKGSRSFLRWWWGRRAPGAWWQWGPWPSLPASDAPLQRYLQVTMRRLAGSSPRCCSSAP